MQWGMEKVSLPTLEINRIAFLLGEDGRSLGMDNAVLAHLREEAAGHEHPRHPSEQVLVGAHQGSEVGVGDAVGARRWDSFEGTPVHKEPDGTHLHQDFHIVVDPLHWILHFCSDVLGELEDLFPLRIRCFAKTIDGVRQFLGQQFQVGCHFSKETDVDCKGQPTCYPI